MNGLPYYKAYPRDFFEGTIGMTFELKGAYRLLLDLIYMQGGDMPDDAKYISGLMGCSVRAWNIYRAKLIAGGQITCENGIISNFRADKELESLRSLQDKQRENAMKPRKNNAIAKAMAQPKQSHTDTDTDIRDSVTNVTGKIADEDDFAKQLFDRAVSFLSRSGTPERQARAFVGKLRQTAKDRDIFDAFAACGKAGAVDPIPWITARLMRPKTDLDAAFSQFLGGQQ